MHRISLLTTLLVRMAFAQTFEVATVKPAPDAGGAGMRLNRCTSDPARFTCRALTLKRLVEIAYDALPSSVTGPGWMDAQRYDISAKPPAGATQAQLNLCLRHLLEERFELHISRKSSTQSVYVLLAPHGAAKLKPAASKDEPEDPAAAAARGRAAAQRRLSWGRGFAAVMIDDRRMSLGELARTLAHSLDRPVRDTTGLEGEFAIELMFAIDRGSATPADDSVHPPSAAEAIEDQLGLKLESRRGDVETIVVASALSKPHEND